jgi:hypothetical protein
MSLYENPFFKSIMDAAQKQQGPAPVAPAGKPSVAGQPPTAAPVAGQPLVAAPVAGQPPVAPGLSRISVPQAPTAAQMQQHPQPLIPGAPNREMDPFKSTGVNQQTYEPYVGQYPLYDSGGDINVNDGKHQIAVLKNGERVLSVPEAEAYRRTHGEKETKMSTRLPKINLFDNGGDVAASAGRRAQADADARLQSLLNTPSESKAPAPVSDTTGDAGAFGIAGFRQGAKDREAAKEARLTSDRGDNVMQPSYMPKINLYDEGGDVQVEEKPKLPQIVVPEEEQQSHGVLRSDANAEPAAPAPLIPMKGDTSPSDQLIPTGQPTKGTPQERAAIRTDKQKAMGSGDLVALGKAVLAERHLEPSTSDVAGPIAERPTAGLPKIALSQEHQETAGGPLISGAPSTETPSEQRDLRNMERKARVADLEKQRQTALSAGDLSTADRLAVAKAELQKTPWADRSLLGKIGHVASVAGNVAGDLIAPNVMAQIPGTALNRSLKERSAYGRILPDAEAEEKTAQAAKAQAELKAGPAEKPAEYEIKSDDQGRMWRVDKLSKQPPQLITFNPQGQPTLSAAPAGVQPPAFEQPTFGKKTEKGKETPANAAQMSEFTPQMAVIAPDLTPAERSTFAFPKGYTPTVGEIEENKKLLREANASKLAGKREDLANQTAQAALNKRTQEEKMVEQIAKDIAPMDVDSLSQLKNITSMRSDQRSLIYARAKELNSHFNTAEVDRRVKMLDNFTNGKDAQNIQSFGTFFEHAGNASQIVNDLRNGATPKIVNVAINKLEKEGWGTTATQISAALEPVRKEFEGFLLGGRALYADDRKAAETILSDSSTPAQIQAALKVLAHTASARYNEMNNRFKNTMKVNIDEGAGPLAPEAYDAAGHLGIKEMGGYELRNGKEGYRWYPKE